MNSLVRNARKYEGEYVTTCSFNDNKVISHGIDPVKVVEEAKRKGIENPVIIFVPEKNMAHAY